MRELKRITEAEMRELLRDAYSRDPGTSPLGQLARNLSDSASPTDDHNDFPVHPLCLTLGLILLSVICVFLYFSFVAR